MSEFEHEPGSLEARARDCTCSPALNRNGAGVPGPNGRPLYECDKACPIHGIDVALRAVRAGKAHRIPPPDQEGDEPPPKR